MKVEGAGGTELAGGRDGEKKKENIRAKVHSLKPLITLHAIEDKVVAGKGKKERGAERE